MKSDQTVSSMQKHPTKRYNMTRITVPALIGAKIVGIRSMTQDEKDEEGWYGDTTIIKLDSGVEIYALSDPEGNNCGCLCGKYKGSEFYIEQEM